MKKQYQTSIEHIGVRLDKCLSSLLEDKSRSFVMNLIDKGLVFVNDKNQKASYRIHMNDVITVEFIEAIPLEVKAEQIPLEIVYEDSDIIVINKPCDMVVHPSHGHHSGTLVNALLSHCDDLSGINGIKRPGIVHRIDKDTSGLLVIAKNDAAHEFLAAQLKSKTMHREYIALVKGTIKEDDGKIIAPIGRDKKDRLKMAVDVNGREAVTYFHVEKRFAKYTLITCLLETGRTHQIRVHLAHIGYPIEGDPLYCRRNLLYKEGQLLHARKLVLIHPKTHEKMEFICELPNYFKNIIAKLA